MISICGVRIPPSQLKTQEESSNWNLCSKSSAYHSLVMRQLTPDPHTLLLQPRPPPPTNHPRSVSSRDSGKGGVSGSERPTAAREVGEGLSVLGWGLVVGVVQSGETRGALASINQSISFCRSFDDFFSPSHSYVRGISSRVGDTRPGCSFLGGEIYGTISSQMFSLSVCARTGVSG